MLNFGTGGVPITSPNKDNISGVRRIRQLDLSLLELEFVYGVKMQESTAKELNAVAKENNVNLTIHGPYYINLATSDSVKLKNSYRHILDSARIGSIAGAKSVTFHPAFIQKSTHEEVYKLVKKCLIDLTQKVSADNLVISISPELTGKESQFGRLEDLIKLCKEIKGLRFCYDFAHNYARSIGGNNSEKDLTTSFELIKSELGKDFLQNMHLHISNIEFSDKGERNHLPYLEHASDYWENGILTEKENKLILENTLKDFYSSGKKIWIDKFDWRMILMILKKFEVGGYLVCESPLLEWDALLMKKYYEKV